VDYHVQTSVQQYLQDLSGVSCVCVWCFLCVVLLVCTCVWSGVVCEVLHVKTGV
jgi:hypothetical protein